MASILSRPEWVNTERQLFERASNWNSVQNTNLLLHISVIRQKFSQCPRDWLTHDVPMIVTTQTREEMGPFQLLSLPFSADFLFLFDSVIQCIQQWHQIMTGVGRGVPLLSWQIMFAIAQWVKFFGFTFSLKKGSNSMLLGVDLLIWWLENIYGLYLVTRNFDLIYVILFTLKSLHNYLCWK